jgi:acylphosphatase
MMRGRAIVRSMPDASHGEPRARITALVRGRVQGVNYRAFVQRHARELKLSGHAENLSDGRVEVVAEGPSDDLEMLLVHLRNGPTHAEVEDVEVTWGEASGVSGFHTY